MTEDGNSLIHGNTRKPREKLVDGCARFQVLEEGLHRNTSSLENPCTAEFTFDSLDLRAMAPIQHELHGMLALSVRQGLNTYMRTGLVLASMSITQVELKVNGETRRVEVFPMARLLDVLREQLQ